MTGLAQRSADRDKSTRDGSVALGAAVALRRSDEPTLDQLLVEPIVQQLMRRDQVDEATIRHLLQETRAARPALRAKDDPIQMRLYGCRTIRLGCGAVATIAS